MLQVCADDKDPRDSLCRGMGVLVQASEADCLNLVRAMLALMERSAGTRAEVEELAETSPSRQVRDAARVIAAEMKVLDQAKVRMEEPKTDL